MKRISVDVSAKQRSKLRNGHSVRVKKGMGLILLVHPERFDLMTKTFERGKARTIALSPEEILANMKIAPEQHNYDIEENAIQDPNELILNKRATKLKKPNAIKAGVIEGQGLANEPPSRTPITNTGGSRGYAVRSLSALKDVSKHLEMLGNSAGQSYNNRINAGLGSLEQNWENGKLSELEFSVGRENQIISNDTAIRGNGLYAGRSVMFGRGHREMSSVNVGGNILANHRVLPPALQSQQDGAFFIQNAQLNPLFKR